MFSVFVGFSLPEDAIGSRGGRPSLSQLSKNLPESTYRLWFQRKTKLDFFIFWSRKINWGGGWWAIWINLMKGKVSNLTHLTRFLQDFGKLAAKFSLKIKKRIWKNIINFLDFFIKGFSLQFALQNLRLNYWPFFFLLFSKVYRRGVGSSSATSGGNKNTPRVSKNSWNNFCVCEKCVKSESFPRQTNLSGRTEVLLLFLILYLSSIQMDLIVCNFGNHFVTLNFGNLETRKNVIIFLLLLDVTLQKQTRRN